MVLVFWGMIGNWTDKFGFKNIWEIVSVTFVQIFDLGCGADSCAWYQWAYQAFYGLLVCKWSATSVRSYPN